MSASEATQNFETMLDAIERDGESILITRGGHRVATVTPAPRGDDAALRAVMERWNHDPGLDTEFARNVTAARSTAVVDDIPGASELVAELPLTFALQVSLEVRMI